MAFGDLPRFEPGLFRTKLLFRRRNRNSPSSPEKKLRKKISRSRKTSMSGFCKKRDWGNSWGLDISKKGAPRIFVRCAFWRMTLFLSIFSGGQRGGFCSSRRDVTGLNRAQNKLKGRDGEREKGEINIEIWSRRRVGLNIEISLVNWKYVGRDLEKVRLLQANLALTSRVAGADKWDGNWATVIRREVAAAKNQPEVLVWVKWVLKNYRKLYLSCKEYFRWKTEMDERDTFTLFSILQKPLHRLRKFNNSPPVSSYFSIVCLG